MEAYKSLFLYLGMAGVLCFGMASCSDDDDDLSAGAVPKAVTESFMAKYPNAKNVEWKSDQQFYVADFNVSTFDTEAWFGSDGTWAMTETDYDSMVNMLPIEVTNAFNDSQYASWIVDDVALYEKPVDSFCVIEVETNGFPEIALFYDTFGNLINKVQGDYFDITPNTVPTAISY